MSGVKLAALYGIWPFQLGLCGPRERKAKTALLNYLQGKATEEKAREILTGFEAAFPYYCLIAEANDIKDPFDEKVVKAYWVGNELLEKVKISDLRKMIIENFSKPGLLPREIILKKSKEIPEKSKPHHSFHVLIFGSITGKVPYQAKYLDLCRISWGKAIGKFQISNPAPERSPEPERSSVLDQSRTETKFLVRGSKFQIVVRYRPLVNNKTLKLGRAVQKEINWDKELMPKVKMGDWVSIHWNNLVQALNKEDLANLKKYTKITLKGLSQGAQ